MGLSSYALLSKPGAIECQLEVVQCFLIFLLFHVEVRNQIVTPGSIRVPGSVVLKKVLCGFSEVFNGQAIISLITEELGIFQKNSS